MILKTSVCLITQGVWNHTIWHSARERFK